MLKHALASVALAACAASASAELVLYPEYPAAIERDYAYGVRVIQGTEKRQLPVYNHCEKSQLNGRTRGGDVNRRFCAFAFSGEPVRVDMVVTEDVRSYKVFPSRLGLRSAFKDGVLSVWLDRPAYFGVQLNDYDKTILSVFADAPEKPEDVPSKGAPGVLYVDGWMDAPGPDGVITTDKETREVYIAPGAVLNARLKVRGRGTKVHGRGMVLDPLSDIFRYDQTKNASRGVIGVTSGCTVEGVTMVDARTFNLCGWGDGIAFRNVKQLASMMCTDGFTVGGRDFRAENCWLYVGDNALVISGVRGAVLKDIAIGTSCAAIFPQGSNTNVVMEGVDVFRADDGLINNFHNGVLRRNNKWSELGAGLQKKEPGPQDLKHQFQHFVFRDMSAVDCTLFSHFFAGRNMGTLPKTFVFDGLSIPHSTGRDHWQAIGKTDGVAINTRNDPKRWLITDNYRLSFTNLWLGGVEAEFAPGAFNSPTNVRVDYARTDVRRTVPLQPNRHEVNWTCPYKVTVGGALQRDWRLVDRKAGPRDLPEPNPGANLLEEPGKTRSVWQRFPSWLVKLEATSREDGDVVYRLVQCEKGAGMQAVLTDGFLRRGNGRWRLAFEMKAKSETPFDLKVSLLSNEKRTDKTVRADLDGAWHACEVTFDTDFDLSRTELVSLSFLSTATANEICFRRLSFVRER